jgi:hypothetical protein
MRCMCTTVEVHLGWWCPCGHDFHDCAVACCCCMIIIALATPGFLWAAAVGWFVWICHKLPQAVSMKAEAGAWLATCMLFDLAPRMHAVPAEPGSPLVRGLCRITTFLHAIFRCTGSQVGALVLCSPAAVSRQLMHCVFHQLRPCC